MKLLTEEIIDKHSQKLRYAFYIGAIVLLSLVQLILINFIAIEGLTPDLLLILCVIIAINEGQFFGIFAGFTCGLFFDFVSMDVMGTNALAKTMVGLIAGWYFRKGHSDKILTSYVFLFVVLLSSVAHNIVYYFFYIKPSQIEFFPFFLKYGIASSVYTTVFSVFAILLNLPRRRFRFFLNIKP